MFFVVSIDMKTRTRLFFNQVFNTMKEAYSLIHESQKTGEKIHEWKIYMILPYSKKCPIHGKEKIWKLMSAYF